MALDFTKLSPKELLALVKSADERASAEKSIDKALRQLADLKKLSLIHISEPTRPY